MWIILKFKKQSLSLLKKDFLKFLGNDVKFYIPKLKLQNYVKNKLFEEAGINKAEYNEWIDKKWGEQFNELFNELFNVNVTMENIEIPTANTVWIKGKYDSNFKFYKEVSKVSEEVSSKKLVQDSVEKVVQKYLQDLIVEFTKTNEIKQKENEAAENETVEDYKKTYLDHLNLAANLMFMAIAHVDRLVEGNMINKTLDYFQAQIKDVTKNEAKNTNILCDSGIINLDNF